MKHSIKLIKSIMFLFAVLLTFSIATESHAAKELQVVAKAKNKTTVELKWTKKSVASYEIYRVELNKDAEQIGEYKKIATLSGKKTKYVDKSVKYKKNYSYVVKGYQKKGKKKICKYEGDALAHMRMEAFEWEEYLYSDTETTPDSIRIAGSQFGIYPTAIDIYRKSGTSKWKKIKTVKPTKAYAYFEYIDKDVTKGQTYKYKCRAYKKLNGKKLYGKYSSVMTLTAVNRDGVYTLENCTLTNGKTKSIVIGLTSQEGNGKIHFGNEESMLSYDCYRKKDGKYISTDLTLSKYSYDKENWVDFPEDGIDCLENETVYIMFEAYDGKEFEFFATDVKRSKIEWWLTYNNRDSILDIDFIKGTATACSNGEMYH